MDNYRQALTEAVARLAETATQQESYIKQLGAGVDELALEFDDLFRLAETKLEAGDIAAYEYDILRALDKALQDISGPAKAEFWTLEALSNRSEWAAIRGLARRAITMMGSPP